MFHSGNSELCHSELLQLQLQDIFYAHVRKCQMGHICGRLGRLPGGLACDTTSVRAATEWITDRQREEDICEVMICAWTTQIRGVTYALYRDGSQKLNTPSRHRGNQALNLNRVDQPLEGS